MSCTMGWRSDPVLYTQDSGFEADEHLFRTARDATQPKNLLPTCGTRYPLGEQSLARGTHLNAVL